MFRLFLRLEWKAFTRSAAFSANLAIKIILGFLATIYAIMFFFLGIALYKIIQEGGLDPLPTLNQYLIYYLVFDLALRYFLQKMPVMNVKPLLILPVKRNTIVHFAIGKSIVSFFNIIHVFLFLPFTIVLIYYGYSPVLALMWHLSVMALIYSNSFINLLINNKDSIFYPLLITIIAFGLLHYYGLFDVTVYTRVFFNSLSGTYYMFLLPLLSCSLLYYAAFTYFRKRLRLDTGLAKKYEVAKTENFTWLDQFGTMGTFLKNDIKLIKRNKRSRSVVIASVYFLVYGLLFFSHFIKMYENPPMQVFGGIFVTGGFLFTFGQLVPSWDSAYYQLMMSQNIKYKEYLASKWWLMVIATFITMVIASFYLLFGWKTYLLIVVGAIYNIGVNSHMVLLTGAYVKTPVDLSVGKQAFGNKQAFNVKTLIMVLPKLVIPMVLYSLGYFFFSAEIGFLFIAVAGIIGFAFRNKVFSIIEKVYRTEKYKTIEAYKQKN
jgi:hypothetical protein